mgnify:CR=1 FL=1
MSKNLPALLDAAEVRVAEVLPSGMDPKRVMRLARMAIHKNPRIANCDPVSVIEAIMTASRLGLEIDSPVGGAHLVPFKGKCQMIPDYRGLIKLVLATGRVQKLVARPVYRGEKFQMIQGSREEIQHIPMYEGEKSDDDIVGFYAVATMVSGATTHEYASREEVDKIRARSRAKDNGPWVTDFAAMGCKTMVKRLIKWLPVAGAVAEAVEHDNRAEGYVSGVMESDSAQELLAARARESQAGMREVLEAEVVEPEEA